MTFHNLKLFPQKAPNCDNLVATHQKYTTKYLTDCGKNTNEINLIKAKVAIYLIYLLIMFKKLKVDDFFLTLPDTFGAQNTMVNFLFREKFN